jgi:hypothetical protein
LEKPLRCNDVPDGLSNATPLTAAMPRGLISNQQKKIPINGIAIGRMNPGFPDHQRYHPVVRVSVCLRSRSRYLGDRFEQGACGVCQYG